MPLKYPDILEHNNSNFALVDITELRGNAFPLGQLSETGSIPTDKRNVGALVFVSSSQEFYGFYGQSTSDWDTTSNWRLISDISGSSTAPGSDTQILYNSGGVISADSGLVYSGSRVGIGTTSPTETLTVEGNISGSAKLTIGVGHTNTGTLSSIAGGSGNTASGVYSTIGGGGNNTASGNSSTVSGGYNNTACSNFTSVGGGFNNTASGYQSTIAGGTGNQATGYRSIVGGGRVNTASNVYSTVGGGSSNLASGWSSGIASGYDNTANASGSFVGGGSTNIASNTCSFVGGGLCNTASGYISVISGGRSNTASNTYSTVGGGCGNTASGARSTVGGGLSNTASGTRSIVGGGSSNTASGYRSTIGGGAFNISSNSRSTVGGGEFNCATNSYATIGGGFSNLASGWFSGVFSGYDNTSCASGSFVGGGSGSLASGNYSVVGGGIGNTASGNSSTISGGYKSTASSYSATVGGGALNNASCFYTTIGGGISNTVSEINATVGGGSTNLASGGASVIAGGRQNTASAYNTTIAGGYINCATNCYSTIGGGRENTTSGAGATVSGGYCNLASGLLSTVGGGLSNTASNNYATVGGGLSNCASNSLATIGGGQSNLASGTRSTVGGGRQNTASNTYATVGGGRCNTASNAYSTIGGGESNTASGNRSTVSGGILNTASGIRSTVGGGNSNTALGYISTVGGGLSNIASSTYATVGGGISNTASGYVSTVGGGSTNTASGYRSTIGGGQSNLASGTRSTVGGGRSNTASGACSFVGGGRCNTASGDYSSILGGKSNHTCGFADSFIIGSNLCATAACTTFVNNLSAEGSITGSKAFFSSSASNIVTIEGSGSTILSVDGSSGRLFEVSDDLTDSLFSVNTIAGLPVIEAFADNNVNLGKFGQYPFKIVNSGSIALVTGSFTGSFTGPLTGTAATASYVNPLVQDVIITGSLTVSGSSTFTNIGPAILSGSLIVADTISSVPVNVIRNDNNSTLPVKITNNNAGGKAGLTFSLPNNSNQAYSIGVDSDRYFKIGENNLGTNTRLVIDTLGNIGIGTSSPSYKLDVSGEGRFTDGLQISGSWADYQLKIGQRLQAGNIGFHNGANGSIHARVGYTSATTTAFQIANLSSIDINSYNSDINLIAGNVAFDTRIYLKTKGQTRMMVSSSGVGIGFTDPEYSLDVSGSGRFTDGLTVTGSILHDGDLTVTGKVTAQEFHTEFVSSSIIYESGSTKFGDSSDDVHEFTGSILSDGIVNVNNNALYISGSRVGIGTDTIYRGFDVEGGMRVGGRLHVGDQSSFAGLEAIGTGFSTGLNIRSNIAGTTTQPEFIFGSGQGFRSATSGDVQIIQIREGSSQNIRPSSGNANFTIINIGTEVSQSNATGITRGLYVRPVLTSAYSWRSVEWNNDTGFGLYGAGAADNYLNGSLGIGTSSPSNTLHVAGTTRLSGSYDTAASGSILVVEGSGSAQPIFKVQGSVGELFAITDSLSGSLFSVNDITGLPILEVFSDNTINLGDYQAPALFTTAEVITDNSGSFTVYNIPTASYDGAFYEYTLKSGSNARAGNIMAIWSGASVNFTETTTTDFGDTSGVTLGVFISGSNMTLTGSFDAADWHLKTIVKSI